MSNKNSTSDKFLDLTKKDKKWDHLPTVNKWKERWLRLFYDCCPLLVHAHQIDMKSRKSDFAKPKKNIYQTQADWFSIENDKLFDLVDFIKNVHMDVTGPQKQKNNDDKKRDQLKYQTSIKLKFDHFSKAIVLCLEAFFERKVLDDLDLNLFCELPVSISSSSKTDSGLFTLSGNLPLFMATASILQIREKNIKQSFENPGDKTKVDKMLNGMVNDFFQVYIIAENYTFFKDNKLINFFFDSDSRKSTLYQTLLTICMYIYGLYYYTHLFEEVTKITISTNYKQHILEFISDNFIKLSSLVSFYKGTIASKVERALLNQKSPQKAVNKKAKFVASMISEKGHLNGEAIEISALDLFKIFNHGDISITSDPTKKKYVKLAEEILQKTIKIA